MTLNQLLSETKHGSRKLSGGMVCVYPTYLQRHDYWHLSDYVVTTANATCVYLTPCGDALDCEQIGAQGMELENGII